MAPNTSRGSASNKRKSEKYKQTQEVKQETANISPKMKKIFGFTVEDITSWSRFKLLMNQPRDPAGLGIWRILFGKFVEVVLNTLTFQNCHLLIFILKSAKIPILVVDNGKIWLCATWAKLHCFSQMFKFNHIMYVVLERACGKMAPCYLTIIL